MESVYGECTWRVYMESVRAAHKACLCQTIAAEDAEYMHLLEAYRISQHIVELEVQHLSIYCRNAWLSMVVTLAASDAPGPDSWLMDG